MEGGESWKEPNGNIATYDSVEKHYGKTSLKFDESLVASTEDVFQVHSNVFSTIDNAVATQYSFSAWVLSKGTSVPRLYLVTENGNVNSVTTTIKNQWVRIEGTFLVPANVKKLSLRLENYGYGNTWFDDVMIRKTANAPLSNLQIPLKEPYRDRKLAITYNTFKAPIEINEAGVDILSFVYNSNNDRSVMFYGGLQVDKLQRPNRKYYSADGSMEIKQNIVNGAIEFITYLGGDGYTAPVVYKQTHDATTPPLGVGGLLYLHRDYQGSIIAITNDAGTVLEKRQFDAWGSIIKVQDGAGNNLNVLTILDRGYTGHEHLQSVGIINMNGRLYDPKLHRFLQPDNFVQDPSNTQNYNRYGYCINNPLKYTDPSGEISFKSFGRWLKKNANDIIAGVQIVVGVVLLFTPAAAVGVGLIGAGVGHFAATYNEYKQTGDWEAASKNQGVSFNFSFETDFGYNNDNKPTGVTQNEPVIPPMTKDDVRNMSSGGASSENNFYGVDIRIIPEFFGGGSYYGGAINVPSSIWGGYNKKGLDSYEGRFLMHEYGHFLQEKHNPLWYNIYAAPSSLIDAFFHNQTEHAKHWAEIQASTYAYYYFGFPKNFKNENIVNPNYLSLEIRKSIFRQYLKN